MEPENSEPKPQPPVKSLIDDQANDSLSAEVVKAQATGPATGIPTPNSSYRHLLGFAIGYGLILFFCPLGFEEAFPVPLFPMVACLSSTLLLVALWSVFGQGSYLKRLFWAHLIGAIPVVGLLFGFLLVSIGEWNSFDEYVAVLAIGLISIVPISLGAQLPFWFFRGFFGWQFVRRGDQPERSFDLRDVFMLTFVFALCFAIPQMSAKLQSGVLGPGFDSDVQTISVTEMVAQEDGTLVPVERVLTEAEVSENWRQQRSQYQMISYGIYGFYGLIVFIGTWLSLPVMLFIFRTRETASGCAFSTLYVFGLGLIPLILTFALNGARGVEFEFFLYYAMMLGLCTSAFAIPLMVSRQAGFQLTSPKRFALEQSKGIKSV